MRNTFKAYERLKREQHIDTLFRKGKAFSVFPLRIIYQAMPRGAEPSPVRVGFSIPKKKHRLSVNRHRIRRLLAEAWRLQKHELYPAIPEGTQLQLFLIYTDTTAPTQEQVMQAVLKSMEQLKTIVQSLTSPS